MAIQKISSKVPKDVRTQRAFDSSVLTVVEGKLSPFQGMPTLRGFNYLMLDPSEKITSGREGGPVGSNGYFEKGTLGWSNQAPDNSIESFATSIRSAGGKVDMTKRAADLVKLRAGLANKEKTSFTDDSGNVFIILDNGGTLSLYHQDIQTAHVDIVNSALSNLFAKSDKKELVCGL